MVIETGKISIRDLQFNCILGIFPFEREQEQPVVLNVNLWLDFNEAAQTEDLSYSIDYAKLAEELKRFIRLSCFKLEETLVIKTGEFILENYPKANAVEISIRKPLAIPNSAGAESTVKIRRR